MLLIWWLTKVAGGVIKVWIGLLLGFLFIVYLLAVFGCAVADAEESPNDAEMSEQLSAFLRFATEANEAEEIEPPITWHLLSTDTTGSDAVPE